MITDDHLLSQQSESKSTTQKTRPKNPKSKNPKLKTQISNPSPKKVHRNQTCIINLHIAWFVGMPNQLLNGKWKLLETIGKGSFGKVYLAEGKFGQKVAVKFEDHKVSRPLLKNEHLTYRKLEGCCGFSKVRMNLH